MGNKIDQYRGCLLGLAVGDAMGYPVDKKTWDEICQDYGPNGLLGYDLVNGCADITSYTQMAAFVCNGLLLGAIRGNPDYYSRYMALSLREWVKSQQFRTNPEKTFCWVAQVPGMRRRHCMDTRMLDALSRETLGTPEKPVFRSPFPGSVTTAIGVGLCCETARMTPQQLGRLGAEAVAFTHADPEAFLSGAFLAFCIAGILQEPDVPLTRRFAQAAEALQEQFGRFPAGGQGGKPLAHFQYGCFIVQRLDHGGTQFIGNMILHEIAQGLLNFIQFKIGNAHGLPVARRAVFRVHRHIVDELLLHQLFQHIRTKAVGVQLDGIAQRLDAAQKVSKAFI